MNAIRFYLSGNFEVYGKPKQTNAEGSIVPLVLSLAIVFVLVLVLFLGIRRSGSKRKKATYWGRGYDDVPASGGFLSGFFGSDFGAGDSSDGFDGGDGGDFGGGGAGDFFD